MVKISNINILKLKPKMKLVGSTGLRFNKIFQGWLFRLKKKMIQKKCDRPVAHFCNPNYLGGRDQEDYGLRPA
jgi:hypothetical protein